MIRAIFFDFSGTIVKGKFDVRNCRRSVVGFLKSNGFRLSLEDYDQAMEGALELWRNAKARGREMSFADIESKTLRSLGISVSKGLLTEIESLEFQNYNWKVKAGVREALSELKSKYRIGMISNGLTDSATEVLRIEGLLDYFEEIVISKDVGYRKPNPRIFTYSLARLGVKPQESLFVGDSYVQDVLGAGQVGMKTIWLADEHKTSHPPFDGVVRGVGEVPPMVFRIDSQGDSISSSRAERDSAVRCVPLLEQIRRMD